MRIAIENFMAVRSGTVEMEPGAVTVLTGANMAGKTSALSALAAVLSQTANPYGLPATRTKSYIADGQDHGAVTLIDANDEQAVRWSLRSGELSVGKNAPAAALEVAVGLENPATLTPKAAAEFWEALFLPPSEVLFKQLEKELKEHLTEQELAGVIQIVTLNGWEGVDKIFTTRSQEAKRNWTKITGLRYGPKIAADWLPDGWLTSYDGITLADAEAQAGAAKQSLQMLHVAHAVSQNDHDRAERARHQFPAAKTALETADEAVKDARAFYEEKRRTLDNLKAEGRQKRSDRETHMRQKPTEETPLQCPHCEAPVIMVGGKLAKHDSAAFETAMAAWKAKDDEFLEELDAKSAVVKVADTAVEEARDSLDRVSRIQQTASQELAVIRRDIALLDRPLAKNNADEVRETEAEVERMREQLDRIRARQSAQDLHMSATNYALIAKVLGSGGVRGSAMKQTVAVANRFLSVIADQTGWPRAAVSDEYAISLGDRATLRMCSESERWRGTVALQTAIARMKRDWVLVFDRVDILDKAGRQELKRLLDFLLEREDAPAVVLAATELRPEESQWGAMFDADFVHHINQEGVIQ